MNDDDASMQPAVQLSALIDGELSRADSRFLLRRLEADAALRGQWRRWHLVRASLRGQALAIDRGFADRVNAAIAVAATPRTANVDGVLRWAGGLAVAASVAFAALLVMPGSPSNAPPLAVSPPTPPNSTGQVAISTLRESDLRPDLTPALHNVSEIERFGQPLSPSLRLDPRIDEYLLRHSAAAAHPLQASFAPLIPVAVEQPDGVVGKSGPSTP